MINVGLPFAWSKVFPKYTPTMPIPLMIIPDKNQMDNISELKPGCAIFPVRARYR